MDSSREKVTFRWKRTAVTSPTPLQRRDAGSHTPSRWNMSPDGDSKTLPLSDSPGPEGLGELSLDTPKRKAEELGESTPSLGKVKLRKLSKRNYETITMSKEKSMSSSFKQLDEPTENQEVSPPPSHSFILKKKERTPEEGSKAIYRMAVIAALGGTNARRSSPNIPRTDTDNLSLPLVSSPDKTDVPSPVSLDRTVMRIDKANMNKSKDNSTVQEDRWSPPGVFEDLEAQGDNSEPKADRRSVVLTGPKNLVAQDSSQGELLDTVNEPEAEDCDSSLPTLEYIPESLPCFTIYQKGSSDSQHQQCPSVNPQGAKTSSLSSLATNETTAFIVVPAEDEEPFSPPQRTVFISSKQPPNTGPSKASRAETNNFHSSNMKACLSDPFALPLLSNRGVSKPYLKSTTTRRQSDAGSNIHYPPLLFYSWWHS
ncbi:putative deoxyribonuclease TATDN2 isoform X1 [Lates japonicus]